jgi:hypothetical protein
MRGNNSAPVDHTLLFTRGQESIRIAIRSMSMSLQIFGPGRQQTLHDFGGPSELEDFLDAYEREILQNGWTRHQPPERRIANRG